jgi:glyoxylase-like metal-dependent hydrolase (beta-lactamase superfamily II)
MKIIPLSEGAFTVDQSKKFIPFQLDKDDLQERTKGSLLVEIQPFCVITSKDILILDTGLGFANNNNQMQIHKNLALNGISPLDVTKVLLSHLHKDHSGGIAKRKLFYQFPRVGFCF